MTNRTIESTAGASPTGRLPIGAIFVLGFLVYVGFFYPGFMSPDSASQVLQARRGVYGDWHPPLMAFIWSGIDRLWPGPTGMLVLQSGLLWLGAYLTCRFALRGWRPTLMAVLLAGVMFTPQVFGIAGAIWKDVLMWALLFLVIGLSFWLAAAPSGQGGRKAAAVAVIALVLLVVACLRINAIVAVLPLLAWVVHSLWLRGRRFGFVLAVCASIPLTGLVFAASILVNKALTDISQHSWMSVAVFDVVGTMAHLDDPAAQAAVFETLPEQVRSDATVSAVVASYQPRYWYSAMPDEGPLGRIGDEVTAENAAALSALRHAWIGAIVEQPAAWMRHRWAATSELLGLTDETLWVFAYMDSNGFTGREDFARDYGRNPGPFAYQEALEWRLAKLGGLAVFRPYAHLALLVVLTLWVLIRYRLDRPDLLLIAASGLFYQGALFIAAPSADYRYSHYMVFITLLMVLLTVHAAGQGRRAPS